MLLLLRIGFHYSVYAVGAELSFIGAAKKIFSGPSGILGFYNGVLPYLVADG